jgi:Ca2+-binding RTX toxin-like protein
LKFLLYLHENIVNYLFGNSGSDRLVIATGSDIDIIADFVDGQDRIGLAGTLTFNDLTLSGNSIAFGTDVLATVTGVDTTTLTATDFIEL